jgi:hypothetical protein
MVWTHLDRLHAELHFTHMIHGGAKFIDTFASEWAATKPEITRYICRAEWKKYGLGAGPRRNSRMLEWRPDVVVAFPGENGTADMVKKARAAGVRVIEIEA